MIKVIYLGNAQLAAGSEEVLDVETTLSGTQFWLKGLKGTKFAKTKPYVYSLK